MAKRQTTRTPQTLEETLAAISASIIRNEEEHARLLEQKQTVQAQKDLQDFNTLKAALEERGLTMESLLAKFS